MLAYKREKGRAKGEKRKRFQTPQLQSPKGSHKGELRTVRLKLWPEPNGKGELVGYGAQLILELVNLLHLCVHQSITHKRMLGITHTVARTSLKLSSCWYPVAPRINAVCLCPRSIRYTSHLLGIFCTLVSYHDNNDKWTMWTRNWIIASLAWRRLD